MKLSRSLPVNVDSTNNVRNSSADNIPAKTSILRSISLSETTQAANSLISKEPRFATDSNEIHDNQHHRDVHLKTTEMFMVSPDHNQNKTENNHSYSIKHTTENIETTSIKQYLNQLTMCPVYFTKTAIMPLYENGFDGFDWKPTLENVAITFGSIFFPILSHAYLFKKTAACGIILNLISSASAKYVTNIIDINSIELLKMIGEHDDFPINGHYELTVDIDARHMMQPIQEFSGIFDGKEHIISHLQGCLIQQITGNAVIKNLILSDSTGNLPALANTLKDNATVSFLQVKNSQIRTTKLNHNLGLVVEFMKDSSRIENTIVSSSSIISYHTASACGGLSGAMWNHAESKHNTISFCNFTTHGTFSSIGAISGVNLDDTKIYENYVSQSHVRTHGDHSYGSLGIGRAYQNVKMKGCTFTDSSIKTSGVSSGAGFAAGATYWEENKLKQFITMSDLEAIRCHSLTTGIGSPTHMWVGMFSSANVQVNNSTATNCTFVSAWPIMQSTVTESVMQSTVTESVIQSTVTESVMQSTVTESVMQSTVTEFVMQSTVTEPTMQSTIIAPVATIDDVSFVPILLYGAGAVVGIAAVGLVSYSLFIGYKQGKSGWSLARHPGESCVKWFTDLYQRFSTVHSVQSDEMEMEMEMEGNELNIENDDMNVLSSIPILERNDDMDVLSSTPTSVLGRYENIVTLEEYPLL